MLGNAAPPRGGSSCYAHLSFRTPHCLFTVTLLAACGGDAPKDELPTSNPISAPLSVEDIERWEKGMVAELAAVQDSGTKLVTARTGGIQRAQGDKPYLFTSSTRRFCCRPSAVSLAPTGLVCPRPFASSRAASIW